MNSSALQHSLALLNEIREQISQTNPPISYKQTPHSPLKHERGKIN